MKKNAILASALAMLLLVSCKSGNPNKTYVSADSLVPVSDVCKNSQSDLDKCKSKGYSNFDLTNCAVKVPENISNVYTFNRTSAIAKVPFNDFYKNFTNQLNFFFPNAKIDDYNIRFSSIELSDKGESLDTKTISEKELNDKYFFPRVCLERVKHRKLIL